MKSFRYHLLITLLHGLALLPLCVLYRLSDFIRIIFQHVIKYRRRIIRENLDNVFADKTQEERRKIEAGFYRQLCDDIVETVKILHISDKEMRRRVIVRNANLVEEIGDRNHPVFLLLAHYGNWEWVQEITKHYTHPEVGGELYRPIRDEVMDRIMTRIRSRWNTILVPYNTAFRTILKLRNDHGAFVMAYISDQRPFGLVHKHWTTFLGQKTCYATGAEEMGSRVEAEYLYIDIEKPKRGHYIITFRKIEPTQASEDYPVTKEYLRMLETTIRRQPELWLWSHRRWLNWGIDIK